MMKEIEEILKIARELTALDYSDLNPRRVTTLAEASAVDMLGWPKVAEVLGNGYEFVLTIETKPSERLKKVKGLSDFDLTKIGSQTWSTNAVSVVKGRGKRQRELDRELKKLVS
jgi:hypothetical protein